jgi:hypothetical protein
VLDAFHEQREVLELRPLVLRRRDEGVNTAATRLIRLAAFARYLDG